MTVQHGTAPSITAFIDAHMPFLRTGRAGVADALRADDERGNAFLVLEQPPLRWRFAREKGGLSLELQPAECRRRWYSVDLIRRLFTGQRERSGQLDGAYAAFLGEHLAELETLFSPEQWPDTERRLDELRKTRSRELFG